MLLVTRFLVRIKLMKRKAVQVVLVALAVGVFGVGFYNYFPAIFADDLYPLNYVDEINDCAGRFGLDKPLLAALILKESNYNPRAISRAGAMGLAQVMPATYRGLMARAPELQGLKDDPFDPHTSICVGAAYLAGAMANYGGDWTASLISYNGGDGAARRYLAARSTSVLVTETRLYAPKILAAREVYASQYADKWTGGSMASPSEPTSLPVSKPSDKTKDFWKGFVKDAFARYFNK
jgi:hypothetical protein